MYVCTCTLFSYLISCYHSNGSLASPSSPPHTQMVKKLIDPLPQSWVISGYLMLRMKLPNNRYALTYIVSIYMYIYMCIFTCTCNHLHVHVNNTCIYMYM